MSFFTPSDIILILPWIRQVTHLHYLCLPFYAVDLVFRVWFSVLRCISLYRSCKKGEYLKQLGMAMGRGPFHTPDPRIQTPSPCSPNTQRGYMDATIPAPSWLFS